MICVPEDMLSAAQSVLGACAAPGADGAPARRAALDPAAPVSDTSAVWFSTTLECAEAARSELSHAACHSRLEIAAAGALDAHPGVESWARNFRLGWAVPYFFNGIWRRYEPDFIARLSNGANLIVECKGVEDDKARAAARFVDDYWIPCVAGTAGLDPELRSWRYEMVGPSDDLYGRITDIISQSPQGAGAAAALTGG